MDSFECLISNMCDKYCKFPYIKEQEDLDKICNTCPLNEIKRIYTEEQEPKKVSLGVYEQIRWERDIAIEQLKELGYGLGEKIEPKTGHWIPTYGNVMCSVCGNVKDSRNVGKATHYCDSCGARMKNRKDIQWRKN